MHLGSVEELSCGGSVDWIVLEHRVPGKQPVRLVWILNSHSIKENKVAFPVAKIESLIKVYSSLTRLSISPSSHTAVAWGTTGKEPALN